jgi:hypothetical protein
VDHVYLSGPALCGLYGMFEEDFGDPESPRPYPRVTPTRLGGVLMPFRCPRCPATVDFSNPETREHYRDPRPSRNNHFCPRCGVRFTLNTDGQALVGKIADDGAAPSTVETISVGSDGLLKLERKTKRPGGAEEQYLLGCDLLGSS